MAGGDGVVIGDIESLTCQLEAGHDCDHLAFSTDGTVSWPSVENVLVGTALVDEDATINALVTVDRAIRPLAKSDAARILRFMLARLTERDEDE